MAGISSKVVGKYYTNPEISALVTNPNATSVANNPGTLIAESAIETSEGYVAAQSGSADSSQFDTDTSKPGTAFTPTAAQKKLLRLRVLDSNKKPIVSAGRDVWAMQTNEGTPKLYFFTGDLASTAAPYTMNQDFYVVLPKSEQLGVESAADGFPEFIESADAVIGNNAITNAMLQDNVIGSAEMSDNAIGSAEVANGSLTQADLAWAPHAPHETTRTGQSSVTLAVAVAAGREKAVRVIVGSGEVYLNRTGGTNNLSNTFSVTGDTVTFGAAQPNDSVSVYIEYDA